MDLAHDLISHVLRCDAIVKDLASSTGSQVSMLRVLVVYVTVWVGQDRISN